MNQIEDKLNEFFTKTVSVKLPQSGKEVLVKALPWLALVGGILALLGAWQLIQVATITNNWANVANELNAAYGYASSSVHQNLTALLWLAIVVIAVEGVMMLAAFSPLRGHKKLGWNLIYWVSLVNLVYTVVYAFVDFSFFSLLFSILASVIGLYLLFQVRSYYLGGSAASKQSGK